MDRSKKSLAILIFCALCAWGCAMGPSAEAERVKALEAKNAKLESDFRVVAAARDELRQKVADLAEQHTQLRKELDFLRGIVRERDELKQQLATCTRERDTLSIQYDEFRKNIRELLGQAEARLNQGVDPPVTSAASAAGRDVRAVLHDE